MFGWQWKKSEKGKESSKEKGRNINYAKKGRSMLQKSLKL